MAPAETHLDYHLPQMDGETRAREVARRVARLPGARKIEADARQHRLRLCLDETQTPRAVLESNLLLLGYGVCARAGEFALPGMIHGSLDTARPELTPSGEGRPGHPPSGAWTGAHPPPTARRRNRPGVALSSRGLAALVVLTTGLGFSAARTWSGVAGHPSPWPAALIGLAVAAGLLLIAALFSRRRARGLAWLLSWLAAGVLGDVVGTLLDRTAERFLATLPAPLARGPGGMDRFGTDLADLLVLGGVVWLLVVLGRRHPGRG